MKNNYEIRGDVTAIFLNRKDGNVIETLISTADLDRTMEFPHTWTARWDGVARSYYVCGAMYVDGKRTSVQLSRWIMKPNREKVVDHYNHNTLDNSRFNLRIVTHGENMQNRRSQINSMYSRHRGVTWDIRAGKWHASVNFKDKRYFCGYFDSEEAAAQAAAKGRALLMPYSTDADEVHVIDGEEVFSNGTKPLAHKKYKAARGVYWYARLNKWCALIQFNKQRMYLGTFEAYEDAVEAVNKARSNLRNPVA